jgi:uncharacterized cupredoxin-like copper-binding protein
MDLMKRYLTLGILALAALAAAILAPAFAAAQTEQTINLTLSEFMIMPGSFTVPLGQPVHFVVTNTGKFPHSVTFSKGGKFITLFGANLAPGTSGEADFTFTEAGTWTMYCPVDSHAERGMTGQVTVLAAGAPGMPTTGQADPGPLPWLLLLGLVLVNGGLLLRRRFASRAA